jgi:hypothetical protein
MVLAAQQPGLVTYSALAERRWGAQAPPDRCRNELIDFHMLISHVGLPDSLAIEHGWRMARLYLAQYGAPERAFVGLMSHRSAYYSSSADRVRDYLWTVIRSAYPDPTSAVREECRIWRAVIGDPTVPAEWGIPLTYHAIQSGMAHWLSAPSVVDQELAPHVIAWMSAQEPNWVEILATGGDLHRLFYDVQQGTLLRRLQILEALLRVQQLGALEVPLVAGAINTLELFAQQFTASLQAMEGLMDILDARGAGARVEPIRALVPAAAPVAPPAPMISQPPAAQSNGGSSASS